MLQNLHYCYCIMRDDSILLPRSGEPELLVSSLLFSSLPQAASNPNPSLLLQTLFSLQVQFTKKNLFSTTRDDAQGQVQQSWEFGQNEGNGKNRSRWCACGMFCKDTYKGFPKNTESGRRRNGPTLFFFSFFLCRSFWKSPDSICCTLGFAGPWLLFQEYGSQKFLWYTTVWKKMDNFQST